MPADQLTKVLPRESHEKHCRHFISTEDGKDPFDYSLCNAELKELLALRKAGKKKKKEVKKKVEKKEKKETEKTITHRHRIVANVCMSCTNDDENVIVSCDEKCTANDVCMSKSCNDNDHVNEMDDECMSNDDDMSESNDDDNDMYDGDDGSNDDDNDMSDEGNECIHVNANGINNLWANLLNGMSVHDDAMYKSLFSIESKGCNKIDASMLCDDTCKSMCSNSCPQSVMPQQKESLDPEDELEKTLHALVGILGVYSVFSPEEDSQQ